MTLERRSFGFASRQRGAALLVLSLLLAGGSAQAQWPHPGWRAPARGVQVYGPPAVLIPHRVAVPQPRCFIERRAVRERSGRVVVRRARICIP